MDRESLLLRLRERIVAFATSQVARENAEDLAQEVLMLLHTKYAHLTELDDLLPLSFQIMRLKLQSTRRKGVRRGEHTAVQVDDMPIADGRATPAEAYERQEILDRMKQALASMGDRCRELLRLKLEGKSFPEIQLALKANSINTVYTWDARCRKDLLERMGGGLEGKP